jgi:hypothetical protein
MILAHQEEEVYTCMCNHMSSTTRQQGKGTYQHLKRSNNNDNRQSYHVWNTRCRPYY